MPNGMVNDSIKYVNIVGLPGTTAYEDIANLYSDIFEDADEVFFKQRINEYSKLLSVLAYYGNDLIGFKIGYPYNEDTFYSWVGGVLPKNRNQGIAKQLAFLQEHHAKQQGFTKLRTKSMNRFKSMMVLNLKNGFDITKVYTNTKGQTKIVFEKRLP
jgi:predicted GNAT superfamily acetyltransferase